jgi:hypothetical protein
MEDFNFLNKNRKLAPRFSGPFHILRVKGPHNVELLLTNGQKIFVNVARIKPYFSFAASPSNDIRTAPSTLPANKPLFDLPPLTLPHSRKPGRPRKNFAKQDDDGKVLSLTPTVSFSKLGVDFPPLGVPPANKMALSLAHTHPMRMRSHASPSQPLQ